MDNVKPLTREAFLAIVTKRKVEPVELPGGTVYLKEPEANTIIEYRETLEELRKDNNKLTDEGALQLSVILLTQMACDADGNLLLTEKDATELRTSAFATYQKLFFEALKVTGLTKEAAEEAKNILKNEENTSK